MTQPKDKLSVTLVTRVNGFYAKELKKACQKKGVRLNTLNIDSNNIQDSKNRLGDYIIWRYSVIHRFSDRTAYLLPLDKENYMNNGYVTDPALIYKSYQQDKIKAKTNINTIPTFKFKNRNELNLALKKGLIKYPFIVKPNIGFCGNGVKVIKNLSETKNISNYKEIVFQSFIENEGDFRVLVLGGVPLGIIKRIGDNNINNISKGGRAYPANEEANAQAMLDNAAIIAGIFDLSFCGVDFISDSKTGKTYFLEVYSAPQWEGFQSVTNINVASRIIDYILSLKERKNKEPHYLVQKYYDSNLDQLRYKRYHYLSRMYLWSRESKYLNQLKKEQKDFIGISDYEINEILKSKLEKDNPGKYKFKELRKEHFKKYPYLRRYNILLFRYLFSKSIHNLDIKKNIASLVPDKVLVELKNLLYQDKKALFYLSTHAINFLFNLRGYLGKDNDKDFINPEYLLQIGKQAKKEKVNDALVLYFFTHCIIGESRFYQKLIKTERDTYIKMFKLCEEIILENYHAVKLDNKLEFLVCGKLLKVKSSLEKAILAEADDSLSNMGNFIIDRFNTLKDDKTYNNIMRSEHRNVLYIMAKTDFKGK